MSVERARVDFTFYYGDDDYRELTLTTTDSSGNEVPHDLSVYSDIIMQAKVRKSQSSPAVEEWSLGDGLSVEGTGDNILKIDATWSRVQDMVDGGEYHFDIRFLQSGEINTLIEGTIAMDKSVSERL